MDQKLICANCSHSSFTVTHCNMFDKEIDYDNTCKSHNFSDEQKCEFIENLIS